MKEKEAKLESKLFKKTIELYKNRSIQLTNEVIAEKTGLGYVWLTTFCNTEDPGVCRIETLYNFLSQKRLEV